MGKNIVETTGHDVKPNVVLITLDACRYDLLVENLDSLPNLKALAARSAFFENAFSVGAATLFAFPAIIGGVYPYQWGTGICRGVRAIDEVMKGSGYRTAFIIEWNPLLSQQFGYGAGADLHVCKFSVDTKNTQAGNAQGQLANRTEARAWRHLRRPYPLVRLVHRLRPLWENNRSARLVGGRLLSAAEFVRRYLTRKRCRLEESRKRHNQFRTAILDFTREQFQAHQLLWIHTTVNHCPYLPAGDGSRFTPARVNYLNTRGISKFVDRGICRQLKDLYVESMKVSDNLVGDVLATLSSRGLLENCIIVVTADHGEEFLEEGDFGHDVESSSDMLLRVPLMMSWESVIKPARIAAPVCTIDIPPTLCDLVGIDRPENFRGVSLKRIIREECLPSDMSQQLWSRPIFSEGWVPKDMLDRNPGYLSHRRVLTVRKGRYKLKVTEQRKGEGTLVERLELFDWVDGRRLIAEDSRDVVEEMRYLLAAHIHEEGILVKRLQRQEERNRVKGVAAKVGRRLAGVPGI